MTDLTRNYELRPGCKVTDGPRGVMPCSKDTIGKVPYRQSLELLVDPANPNLMVSVAYSQEESDEPCALQIWKLDLTLFPRTTRPTCRTESLPGTLRDASRLDAIKNGLPFGWIWPEPQPAEPLVGAGSNKAMAVRVKRVRP